MNYFAFFDVDHTILRINSAGALLRGAYKKGILSKRRLISACLLGLLYKLKIIDSERIIKKFASWLTNYPVSEMESLCSEIVKKDLIPVIRPQIRAEIKKHQAQRAHLAILSSAIAPICIPLAKHLEISSVLCTELETDNSHYTGFPKGQFCYRKEKRIRMLRFLETNQVTPEYCYYYGDSMDDLSVLQTVGNPVCVNPGKNLIKLAREHNWKICIWE